MRNQTTANALRLIVLGIVALASSVRADAKLNVLLIVSDDLRDTVGCYGNAGVKTPNIDRLAARGVLFRRAYAQYAKGAPVRLFVLAGHRNMEGERAFTGELKALPGHETLAADDVRIAFKYSIGGGYKISKGWEPLGPAGFYDTFGPELSFGKTLQDKVAGNIAIAKFTHSGSQMNEWTPAGTHAKDRNLYPHFIAFVQESVRELQAKGHPVELAGIFYHVGENDVSFGPYRRDAAKWLQSTVAQSRVDLGLPSLAWHVSQQPPTDEKGLNAIDVTANLAAIAAADPAFIHVKAIDLPPQEEDLVITTAGIVRLGELLAKSYLARR
jgi:hypothetical protein